MRLAMVTDQATGIALDPTASLSLAGEQTPFEDLESQLAPASVVIKRMRAGLVLLTLALSKD
jgi:hypothetical protein